MNEKPDKDYWDDIGRSFNAARSESLWREHSDRVNGALFERWLGDRRRTSLLKTDLFDEAVTDGLLPCLERLSDDVCGVDLSSECVEMASRRYPGHDFRQADVRALPFRDERFDCVVSNSTLDHFDEKEDIAAGLSELFRVLQPGGTLIVTFDNLQNPLVALRNALPFPLLEKIGLVPYFVGETVGRRGLVRLLRNTGFVVEETRPILHCPRVLAVPMARRAQRTSGPASQESLLERLSGWERLADWPTAGFSGHFIAALATRPEE